MTMNVSFRSQPHFGFNGKALSRCEIPTEQSLGGANCIPNWHSQENPGFYSRQAVVARNENWGHIRECMFTRISDSQAGKASSMSGDAVFLIGYFVATDDEAVRWQSAKGLHNLSAVGASNARYSFHYIQPVVKDMFLKKIEAAKSPCDFRPKDFDLLLLDRGEVEKALITRFLVNRQTPLSPPEAQALGNLLLEFQEPAGK